MVQPRSGRWGAQAGRGLELLSSESVLGGWSEAVRNKELLQGATDAGGPERAGAAAGHGYQGTVHQGRMLPFCSDTHWVIRWVNNSIPGKGGDGRL